MGEVVELYIYDLTRGMAAQMSPMLLGKRIEGVWHTSIVCGGVEHFFGYGLQRAVPGSTHFGRPFKILPLGTTEIPEDMRDELLADISARFQPEHYSLLNHNCNNFSHEFAQLLVGQGIPEHILNQAQEVLSTPMGQMLMPMLMQMEGQLGNARANGFGANGFSAGPAGPSATGPGNATSSTSGGASAAAAASTSPSGTQFASTTITSTNQAPATPTLPPRTTTTVTTKTVITSVEPPAAGGAAPVAPAAAADSAPSLPLAPSAGPAEATTHAGAVVAQHTSSAASTASVGDESARARAAAAAAAEARAAAAPHGGAH